MLDLDSLKNSVLKIEKKLLDLDSLDQELTQANIGVKIWVDEIVNLDFHALCNDSSYNPYSDLDWAENNRDNIRKKYNNLWNSIKQMIIDLISSALSNIEAEIETLNCTLDEITSNSSNDIDIRTQTRILKIKWDIEKLTEKQKILINLNDESQNNLKIHSVVGKLYHLFVYDSIISTDSNMINNRNFASLLYSVSFKYKNTYINTYTLLRMDSIPNDINAAIAYKNKLIDLKVLSEDGLFIMPLDEIRKLEHYYYDKNKEQEQ